MKFKLLVFFLVILAFIQFVIAMPIGIEQPSYKFDLKSNNSYGEVQVLMWYGNEIQVIGYGVPENNYALVYIDDKNIRTYRTVGSSYSSRVGSSYTSRRYPQITCLIENISVDEYGLNKANKFNYILLSKDRKNQTLYLIPSSEVICKKKKLLAWNIGDYFISSEKI